MSNKLLDHLDELVFENEMDVYYATLDDAINKIVDRWLELGYIDDEGKEEMLEEWEEDKYKLFEKTLG
jgi:hypothetical protein